MSEIQELRDEIQGIKEMLSGLIQPPITGATAAFTEAEPEPEPEPEPDPNLEGVKQWAEERTVVDNRWSIGYDLHLDYGYWAWKKGHSCLNIHIFGKALRDLGIERKNARDVEYRIALVHNDSPGLLSKEDIVSADRYLEYLLAHPYLWNTSTRERARKVGKAYHVIRGYEADLVDRFLIIPYGKERVRLGPVFFQTELF